MTKCKILYLIFFSLLILSCRQTNTELSSTKIPRNIDSTVSKQAALSNFQFDGGIHGCGNFLVYRTTKDGTKAISVKVNKEALKITDKTQIFQIEANDFLEVYIDDFGEDDYKNRMGYCFDLLIFGRSEPIRYPATKGEVTIYTSKTSEKYFYNATVTLKNVAFQTPDNKFFNIENIEIKDVKVGWLPG